MRIRLVLQQENGVRNSVEVRSQQHSLKLTVVTNGPRRISACQRLSSWEQAREFACGINADTVLLKYGSHSYHACGLFRKGSACSVFGTLAQLGHLRRVLSVSRCATGCRAKSTGSMPYKNTSLRCPL